MHSERDGTPASGCVCNVQQMIVHAVWRFLATSTEATRLGSCSQGVCAFRALREERGGHFKSRNREVEVGGAFSWDSGKVRQRWEKERVRGPDPALRRGALHRRRC